MRFVFIDTEFSDFARPRLLSLGMACLDGEEFYAELDPHSADGRSAIAEANDFVRGPDVLGQWGRVPDATAHSLLEIGQRAAQWLNAQFSEVWIAGTTPLAVCSDSFIDFEFLAQLLEKTETVWRERTPKIQHHDIGSLLSDLYADRALQRCHSELASARNLRPHHALADALAMRSGFIAMRAQLKSPRR